MEEKLAQIADKVALIEDEIADLETSKRILQNYSYQLKWPSINRQDWSEEAENILKRS